MQQVEAAFGTVAGGIDADHRVAAAQQQAIDDAGEHTPPIVGRMVGLQARRQPVGQSDRRAEFRDDAAFRGDQHKVLVATEFRDGCDHLRREAGGQSREHGGRRGVGQQPVAQAADREMRDGRERVAVVRIEDQPRDVVVLVRDECLTQERLQRQIGQRQTCGDALDRRSRRDARQPIAGAQRRGFRQQRAQITKRVARRSDRGGVHGNACVRTARTSCGLAPDQDRRGGEFELRLHGKVAGNRLVHQGRGMRDKILHAHAQERLA